MPRYSATHARRHEVRPGLTGLAQVHGRNALDWNRKLDLDVEYVNRRSFVLDATIILRTLKTVFVREGISSPGEATAREFMGSGVSLRSRGLTTEDLATRVAWLRDPTVRSGVTIDFWPDVEGMRNWFERTQSDDSRRDFVCVDEDSNLASMFGFINMRDSTAEIYLFADPERLSQGIGRNTMVQLLKLAVESDLTRVTLETKSENHRALRLYEKFGFSTVGEVSATDKIVMVKDLRSTS